MHGHLITHTHTHTHTHTRSSDRNDRLTNCLVPEDRPGCVVAAAVHPQAFCVCVCVCLMLINCLADLDFGGLADKTVRCGFLKLVR